MTQTESQITVGIPEIDDDELVSDYNLPGRLPLGEFPLTNGEWKLGITRNSRTLVLLQPKIGLVQAYGRTPRSDELERGGELSGYVAPLEWEPNGGGSTGMKFYPVWDDEHKYVVDVKLLLWGDKTRYNVQSKPGRRNAEVYGGMVQRGESSASAASREVEEESGHKPGELWPVGRRGVINRALTWCPGEDYGVYRTTGELTDDEYEAALADPNALIVSWTEVDDNSRCLITQSQALVVLAAVKKLYPTRL